ncbi:MAG: hypothetical protein Q4A39_03735, partial [Eubacteriales bacterium]|nr:hypothetical protein [Eubacteriales bacterium]
MSDREYDYPLNDWNFDELDTIDASEFSLEAILAEFRSAPRDARPTQEESIQEDSPVQVAPIQEEESAEEPADESASVVLTEEENDSDIGSASISSIDELLEPETVPSEPAPDLVEPEEELSEATDEEAPSASDDRRRAK